MADELAGRQLGGFQLIRLLGEGAHGSVWLANQLRLDREVALKILDPVVARNADTARRFEREGRAAASLDHPNIVPVYEAGEDDGLVYLVMRLVDGPTLQDRLAEIGQTDPAAAATFLSQIGDALDHAHHRGLIHRDVKPSNILIEGDSVWLADFGIAASVREIGAYTTGALGTAEYMAPEQASAADVDHRADLYSLGCVAFEMLEGRPPYTRGDLISTLMAHVNDPIPITGDSDRDAFYARAIAKDPNDRFGSGHELVEALRGLDRNSTAGSTQTISMGRPRSDPLESPATSKRRLFVGAALAIVALVAVGTAFLFPRADDESQSADRADVVASSSTIAVTTTVVGNTSTSSEAAASTEPPVPTLAQGGTVDVGTTRSLASVNVHVDRSSEPFITGHVLPPLMQVTNDWSLTPWLAADEPVVQSTDPLVVRWVLRSDATWDDGTPVTSTDVARTLDYILHPESGAVSTLLYQGLTVNVIDDTTFDLSFVEPVGAHRLLFSTVHPVIKAAAYDEHLAGGESPATFLADGIDFSAGPYVLAGFDPAERITLVPNESFWADRPLLDRVTIRTYDGAADQINALESRELDVAYVEDGRATHVAQAKAIEDAMVDVGFGDLFLRLDMNTRKGPMSDILVRQAVAHAIDRSLITESSVTPITSEIVKPLQSLVWPSSQAANKHPFEIYQGNDAAADALLQEAGWQLGAQGARFKADIPLEVRLFSAEQSSLAEQALVQTVVVQLLEAGVRVEASVLDNNELFNARLTGDYDIVVAIDLVNPDPVATTVRFGSQYCPASFGVAGCDSAIPANFTGVNDEQLEQLFVAAESESNAGVRSELYGLIDQRLAEVVPALPLYELPTFAVYGDELGGISVDTHRGGPFVGMAGWGFLE